MPVGGGLLGAAGALGGGILGSDAANDAIGREQAAAQQGNSILSGVQSQTTGNLQPYVNTGQQANSALAGLLGIGGNPAASSAAFNNYLGSTNYNFVKNQGEQGIEYAGAPSFNSSATAKALDSYNTGLAGSALSGYEGLLGGLSTSGITAGSSLGSINTQNAGAQATNLLDASGYEGNAGIYGASAQTNALRGITSGLSSFGSQGGFGNLFGGGGGGGVSAATTLV